ncbi:MAG: hypothetical protein DRI88_01230 [Bacteroidetes bacterium]|nr:MAG: hypothetical protein DRI72_00135 [Bacteroidota bacterium]RLD49150.1 MAG: hypothetical protein DRI88_01230 [Bacteroidota bacterium]RLD71756.1 MAG: hypothetical protein DRI87_06555 [Bacteroidota bacterium]RLD88963.1 MAG: hypothetical protein DRJ02_02610 [Bacteroidota bacterium]HHL57611.1 T9SS type A sorting domain-containing protein [Bacteroidota bacterium]
MKQLKFLLLAAGFIVATSVYAQEMPRRVFAAGGGQGGAGNVELSWTIGQSGMVGTFVQPSVVLNTGFQQFDNLMVSTDEILSTVSCTVYPNPFRDQIYLDIQTTDPVDVFVRLFDNYGRLLLDKHLGQNVSGFRQSVQTQQLAPGMYSLLVTFVDRNNETKKQLFKLIKH